MNDVIEFKCAFPAIPAIFGAIIFIRKVGSEYEARQAIAIFGDFQMSLKSLENIDYNPYHDDFHDNFVSGKGLTEEAALKAMKKDSDNMYESLWR